MYCIKCQDELIYIDLEAQTLKKEKEYYLVKQIAQGETWETCHPQNKFEAYCETCFTPRLEECRKRVIGLCS